MPPHQAGDLLIAHVGDYNSDYANPYLYNAPGWSGLGNIGPGLGIFYKIAASSNEPAIDVYAPQGRGIILVYRGVNAQNPFASSLVAESFTPNVTPPKYIDISTSAIAAINSLYCAWGFISTLGGGADYPWVGVGNSGGIGSGALRYSLFSDYNNAYSITLANADWPIASTTGGIARVMVSFQTSYKVMAIALAGG